MCTSPTTTGIGRNWPPTIRTAATVSWTTNCRTSTPLTAATAPDDPNQYFDIQETFDVDDWRQVRIPLDQYTGRTNLRLRVDFSTAGDLNIANAATGEEIRTVAGIFIQDGQTAQIGPHVLEFDSGLTIVAPTGAAIPLNEEMTLTDELDNTTVLRFVSNTLTSSDMVVTDGSQLFDGDVFSSTTAPTTRFFEFDSGFILTVPPTGSAGINDQEILLVDLDGAGVNLPVAFEFDKNGVLIDVDGIPGPDNGTNIVNIADNLTILVPATGAQIGDGDMMSLSNGVTTYTFEFDKDGTLINPFNLPINAAKTAPCRCRPPAAVSAACRTATRSASTLTVWGRSPRWYSNSTATAWPARRT